MVLDVILVFLGVAMVVLEVVLVQARKLIRSCSSGVGAPCHWAMIIPYLLPFYVFLTKTSNGLF